MLLSRDINNLVSTQKEQISPRRKDRKVITYCYKIHKKFFLGVFAPLREKLQRFMDGN